MPPSPGFPVRTSNLVIHCFKQEFCGGMIGIFCYNFYHSVYFIRLVPVSKALLTLAVGVVHLSVAMDLLHRISFGTSSRPTSGTVQYHAKRMSSYTDWSNQNQPYSAVAMLLQVGHFSKIWHRSKSQGK
jgi:hypothetical protein